MPIYEYACTVCGERFEKFFRTSASAATGVACPACQSQAVQRLMSAPAIHAGNTPGSATTTESAAAPPPVFGRKELHQAMEQKRQLKEQANYEAKQAGKKP